MIRYSLFFLLSFAATVAGCRIVQEVPEGGRIASSSGDHDCDAGTCTIDLASGSAWSEIFTGEPEEGFVFSEWKKAQGYLCGGSSEPCALQLPADQDFPDATVYLEPVFSSLTGERSSLPADPPAGDLSFATQWVPSRVASCIVGANESPVLAKTTAAIVDADLDRTVYEPAVVFTDEAFTVLLKQSRFSGASVTQQEAFPDYQPFRAVDGDSSLSFFDDGTHGDLNAGDGVYTRSCVGVTSAEAAGAQPTSGAFDLFMLNPNLRGTESTTRVAKNVRMNNVGIFVSIGDDYSTAMGLGRHWEVFDPGSCKACHYAWHFFGDVFDFFVVSVRQAWAGVGYTRVHDFIAGTGHNPPYANYSYWDGPMDDGREHPEYIGMIYDGYPGNTGGTTHEMGHGLLGINTKDFPVADSGQWNDGDGAHIDSDTTLTGDLQGPLWDPVRGFPIPVKYDDGSEYPWQMPDAYLEVNEQGQVVLSPKLESSFRWADIFLYMMGLIDAEDSTERYLKLINPKLINCESTTDYLICPGQVVTADESIEFGIADMVERYGPWQSFNADFDPSDLAMGILFVSDREHTEAEITLHTMVNREISATGQPLLEAQRIPWTWTTRGLSRVRTDFTNYLLPN
ncbi:MAG: choice-of-anchor X domain-containing protein [Pseudomonadota bacterium]